MKGPHFHRCCVPTCGGIVSSHTIMCRKHWRLVPEDLQSEWWEAHELHKCGELSAEDLDAVRLRATQAVVTRTLSIVKGGAL